MKCLKKWKDNESCVSIRNCIAPSFNGYFHNMGSKFSYCSRRVIRKKTSMTDSFEKVPTTIGELPDSPQKISSVRECLDLQNDTKEKEGVEHLISQSGIISINQSESTDIADISVYTSRPKYIGQQSLFNEMDIKCDGLGDAKRHSLATEYRKSEDRIINTVPETTSQNADGCMNEEKSESCSAIVPVNVESVNSLEWRSSEHIMHTLMNTESSISRLGLTAEEIDMIKNDVEIQLDKMCPIVYFDFCLITCDIDYEEASEFRTKFCRDYNLTGCMLYDTEIASLGEDIFDQYEGMMERSTKVFFYHTENYKKDSVHCRVQNGAVYQQLWERLRRDKDKCVPVFPNGSHKLGLALSGVSGLDPTIPQHMRRRVLATFTDKVRNIRILKEEEARKRRPVLCRELLDFVIQNYIKRKQFHSRKQVTGSVNARSELAIADKSAVQIQEDSVTSPVVSNVVSSRLQQMLTALSVEEGAQTEILKLVTSTCENNCENDTDQADNYIAKSIQRHAQNDTREGISISDSSNIHVGPRIELNVHINATGEGTSHQDTKFDSDDDA